jgi:hypothetical protein
LAIDGRAPGRGNEPAGRWRIAALAALLLTVATMPASALAYVLEGPHILHLTAKAMGRIASLEVSQKLLVYPRMPDAAARVFDETAIYIPPERFRSDLMDDRIRRSYLVFGDSSLTVIDGRVSDAPNPFDNYQQLLRSRTRRSLMRTLHHLRVETAITSLGRLDEQLVFIIGARYPDESVSQLAVDKETFLPVRLLLVGEDGGQHLEIVYDSWRRHQNGAFPYHILFYLNGQLNREIRVVDLRLNPSVPAAKMDMEALLAETAATNPGTSARQKQEAVEAVKQAVEDFQKKFD